MSDDGSAQRGRLSRGGLLARNSFLNVGGQLLILLLAFFAVPILIDDLGDARFGLLTIAWVIIGYAGLFDLGLSRALTALAADRMGTGRAAEVPVLFWTALATMLTAGLIGALAFAGLSPWLVSSVLNVADNLEDEALVALILLGATLPFVIGSQALKAILETEQRFDIINGIQVPASALSYFGPVLALQFWTSLPAVVGVVVASRVIGFIVMFVLTMRAVPALRERIGVERSALKALFSFGGWVIVSNLVSPILSNLDRVFVGALVSVAAVTYYATPQEIVRRMWIPSFAIAGVLFPAFALTRSMDPRRAAKLFDAGNRAIFATMFPITLIVIAFSGQILTLWLGSGFADRSELVMQLLALGVFANALAQVPFGFVQSGRPAISALVEVAQVVPFVFAFVLLTNAYGIEGAALAWAGRQLVDAVILHTISGALITQARGASRRIGLATAMALGTFALVTVAGGVAVTAAIVAVTLVLFVPLCWIRLMTAEERDALKERLTRSRLSWRRPTRV